MTWVRLVLMLYFFMVARKAACQTLSKAFLKSVMVDNVKVWTSVPKQEMFSRSSRRKNWMPGDLCSSVRHVSPTTQSV